MATYSPHIAAQTLRLERYRAVLTGIYESSHSVFLLLILVRWFDGSGSEKSLIAASAQAGLLLAPLVVFVVRTVGGSVARIAGLLFGGAAVAMVCASIVESSIWFTGCATAAVMLCGATAPLFTTIYAHNYSPTTRGRDYAQSSMIRIASSVIFAGGAGWFLSGNIESYHLILWIVAVCLALSAVLSSRIPGEMSVVESKPVLSCFRYLQTDRLLRETTIAWMLLGFGMLMMVPLRVEYLANNRYGLELSEVEIALLLSVIPNVARLLSSPIWGRIFDAIDFFTLRIILNCTLLVGMIGFFAADSWIGLLISAVVVGIGTSGGDLAWNLWVTKFAPLERVSDYMAVHVFFTGIRGVVAPPVGFFLVQYISMQQLSHVGAALMAVSALILTRMRT